MFQICLRKMSLISQNARSEKETKRAEDIEEKVVEDGKEGERKRYGKGEQCELEQVKEMKELQNFLFGSLYSPLEFGKGGDDESAAKAASDLFFTDRSADSQALWLPRGC
jgi:U3 small nucleolar RNA-associated protein 18